jgi:hypothetical protein
MNSKPLISISLAAGLAFVPASAFAAEDDTSAPIEVPAVPSLLLAESAAESLGFDPGTIAEELAAEVQLAIDNGVIAPELVEFVVQAAEETQIKDTYADNVSAATEEWKAEEAAWLEAESEVVASAPLTCAEDPNCKTEMGKTMSAIAAEGLLAQVQARVDEALALPPRERGAALREMGEDIREMRARLQSALSGTPAQDSDDSTESSSDDEYANELRALLERRGIAASNVTDLDADIMERLAEVLTGDDDILENEDARYEDDDDDYSESELLSELEEERRELLEEIEEERRELLEERREAAEEAEEERREAAEEAEEERREAAEEAREERREAAEEAREERREAAEEAEEERREAAEEAREERREAAESRDDDEEEDDDQDDDQDDD